MSLSMAGLPPGRIRDPPRRPPKRSQRSFDRYWERLAKLTQTLVVRTSIGDCDYQCQALPTAIGRTKRAVTTQIDASSPISRPDYYRRWHIPAGARTVSGPSSNPPTNHKTQCAARISGLAQSGFNEVADSAKPTVSSARPHRTLQIHTLDESFVLT